MSGAMPVAKLPKPVWFDTGLKMPDGTPRTVAAYDAKQLNDYRENKSVIGFDEEKKCEKLVLWQQIGTADSIPAPEPVAGVTATTGRVKR